MGNYERENDTGRWTRTDRPEMLSDRLGYPSERGDEEWEKVRHLWWRHDDGTWIKQEPA